jgi:hypothetical protein
MVFCSVTTAVAKLPLRTLTWRLTVNGRIVGLASGSSVDWLTKRLNVPL